jgi:accessory gene regulator protein AgrB
LQFDVHFKATTAQTAPRERKGEKFWLHLVDVLVCNLMSILTVFFFFKKLREATTAQSAPRDIVCDLMSILMVF